MEQLPPKAPITMAAAHNWASFPFQMMPTSAAVAPPTSWMDEFLDFSATRRSAHRRTVSDPIAFVEEDSHNNNMGFDRLDDEQLQNMFSDDVVALGSSSNPSSATPSDQNSDNDDKRIAPELHRVRPKTEPGEVDSSTEPAADNPVQPRSPENSPGDVIADPKRIKRWISLDWISINS